MSILDKYLERNGSSRRDFRNLFSIFYSTKRLHRWCFTISDDNFFSLKTARQLCSFISLSFLLSCETDLPDKVTLTFTLDEKSEAIYNVSETNYAINNEPVTDNYFIRETVVEIEEKVNEKTYTMERYRRPNATSQWRIERVYKLKQTPAELIEIGESPEVRLTFPISENAGFDKNRYNANGELKVFYLNTNKSLGEFPTTYSVYEANDSTLINLKRIYDVYSPTDGLVYKEITDYNYCQSSSSCIGTGEISFGKQVIWRRVR